MPKGNDERHRKSGNVDEFWCDEEMEDCEQQSGFIATRNSGELALEKL